MVLKGSVDLKAGGDDGSELIFPGGQQLPCGMQEKQKVEVDLNVYVARLFLFQGDGGGGAGSVKERSEETAEGSGESCKEG